ncbi:MULTISPECIES: PQQ-dependent dehydrogenase, methanol/ethanol family [unclassified Sphingobium]|uniref:PQQ-dependent dehydrogenase, methanol/ethanol family n=1 Tax=unclassified Sphingobium TaxID=2611147 RepID=UPI00222563BF|nr:MULTISPECIES: PQQ-dependent dehydrogenase, methanol/ethanol family [unclassified Sphingobium]MCW2393758.1 quinohemoprotein ethanol dehydrogenase [Sphingobium sp. B8D3B]MCW2417271.1 quinohemoprotein ethanol dehydrogenase [Sphingobium sp. B8D3C]
MMSGARLSGILGKALLAIMAASLLAACSKAPDIHAQLVDDASIGDVALAGDWLSHGRTHAEDRFSPLDQIDRESVARLGLAWSLDLPSKGAMEATPLVWNGIIYTTGSWGVVYAVDARTGKQIWSYDPQVQGRAAEAIVWDRNRGVALWNGKVYVALVDGRLIALNARTGAKVWTAQTFDRKLPLSITGAPRVFGGKVIIGNAGGDVGTRGFVSAYDAETGKQAWKFYLVPGNPADGFENKAMRMAAKTWTGEWWKMGGGGNPWNAFSYDPALRIVYVATGNGGPWNQHVRSPGGGDNLFLASVVALNVDTGDYVWHYQETPGDSWDFASAMDMILTDLPINGQVRQVLMHAPKNGFFYVLDRKTGQLLSAEKIVPVTWASHVDLKTGRPVEAPNIRYGDGPAVIAPTGAGAHNWQPMSYDPRRQTVFIPYQINSASYQDAPDLASYRFVAGKFDRSARLSPAGPSSTGLLAWDPVRQREKWRTVDPTPIIGGTMTSAGGLVFYGRPDGQFIAVDSDTGRAVWQRYVGGGIVAPPVSFAVDGKQYLAVLTGVGGGAANAGGPIMASYGWRYGEGRRLLVFTLDGHAPMPAAPQADPRFIRPPIAVNRPAERRGMALYGDYCAICHGGQAVNGGTTPDLRASSPEVIDMLPQILIKGALTPAGMPSFAHVMTEAEARDISAYLKAQSFNTSSPVKRSSLSR